VTSILRFAPSPTGYMHLGHARSAQIGRRIAGELGGQLLLRIEDVDPTRIRPEYVSAIHDDLAWLGFTWPEPPRRQSEHFDIYRAAAQRLAEAGLHYPCFATRTEIEAAGDPNRRDPDGTPLYPGLWRNRDASEAAARMAIGEPFAMRLDMAKALARVGDRTLSFGEWDGRPGGATERIQAEPARWGDPVIVRKESPTSYHLSVVVDDALQGVSHVVRGRDLYAATDLHRLLQTLLDLPEPIYHHHALITDATGRKLSKSADDTSLQALRAAGVSAAEVLRLSLASGRYGL
jgi:glutamyl-Q tRNA(Asp) synthetase